MTSNLVDKKIIFELKEFATITGLNCEKVPRVNVIIIYKGEQLDQYWKKKTSLSRDAFNTKFASREKKNGQSV